MVIFGPSPSVFLFFQSSGFIYSAVRFRPNEPTSKKPLLIFQEVQDDVEDASVSAEKDSKEVLSKDGIPLNSEGVASPARIHIRSVKEGGKANPKRLQVLDQMK